MSAADILDSAVAKRGGRQAVAKAAAQAAESESYGPRRLDYEITSSIDEDFEEFDDELVEGVIGRNAMAVLYGDSNSGKTFLAIELAARLSLQQPWLGRNTSGGVVLYLATEGAASVRLRFKAWRKHHGKTAPSVVIVKSPINLFDGDADVTAVLALVSKLESLFGDKVALVIGDTMARISAGANENSGEDMGVVLRNADAIRESTGATFLWIHHTGKDQAKGMRGWSGTRAAIDTEIEITADEATGVRTAEITKQRDLPGKGDRVGFRLVPVELGVNRWGTARGSCVVEPTEAAPKKDRGRRPSEIAGAITEHLRTLGSGCRKTELVKHFDKDHGGPYIRQSVYREIGKMVDDGRLYEVAGIVATPRKPA